jgi:Fur family ferric uptake transcriptional regulator
MTVAKTVLSQYKVKTTAVRQEILQIFLESQAALSQADIEKQLGQKFDRVTIYRTLKTFNDLGIIHEVIDNTAIVKYAKCFSCESHKHADRHVHFKCTRCEHTFCLHPINILPVALPEGFLAHDYHFLVMGLCKDCK